MKKIFLFFKNLRTQNRKMLIIGIVLSVMILFAAIFAGLEGKKGYSADLTANGLYTLSDESAKMLSELKEDIYIYTVYSPGNDNNVINILLQDFAAQSPMIHVANVDPLGTREEIAFAEETYEVSLGSVVVADLKGERYAVLSSSSMYMTDLSSGKTFLRAEGKLVTAINYVVTGETINVRLLYGHQETSDTELTALRAYLDSLNYNVSRYDYLRSSTALDPKTDILVAVSPKTDITAEEYKGIVSFMNDGGTFIVFLDNAVYNSQTGIIELVERDQKYMNRMLKAYGMVNERCLISCLDESKTGFRSSTLILAENPELMKKTAASGKNAVLSECSAIRITENENVKVTPLLVTPAECYANSVSYGIDTVKKEDSVDGSFTVAALSQRGNGKLVLFTSSSILGAKEMNISANSAAILDALSFADIAEPAIEVESKPLAESFELKSVVMKFIWAIIIIAAGPCILMIFGLDFLIKIKRIKLPLIKK